MTADRSRDRSAVLGALGDGTRRAIVELLAERPRPVGELAEELPVSRPAVSLHLKVLRDAGLVQQTAVGTRRIYRLDEGGLQVLRTYVDRLWISALDRFAATAEAAAADERDSPEPPTAQRPPKQPRRPR